MGSIATDVPGSVAGTKPKGSGTDSLENEAVGLEVAVRIHGSQVAAVVLDATEHVEPFEEDTSTMIVFPRGAVVKLQARVRSGHAVVLTHLATKQTALCRIVQVNNAANIANYVKLEFLQPVPGFWGVHFPSDSAAPAALQQPRPPIAEQPPEKPEATVAPTRPAKSSSTTEPAPQLELSRPQPKPIVQQSAKQMVRPAPAPPVSYGASEDITANEIVPLAAAPTKRAPIPYKSQTAMIPPPSRAVSRPLEAPIFDSLSTGEEVFGKESGLATTEETAILKSDSRTTRMFAPSLDPSSLMQSVEAPKTHTGMKVFLSVAAVVILAAGAVFYVRQYRGNARQGDNVATPASIPQNLASTTSSAAPAQTTPPQTETAAPPRVQMPSPTETVSTVRRTPAPVATQQGTITVTPVHNGAKSAGSDIHPTISNGLADIYAGDLAARPQPTRRKNTPLQTSVPTINGAPKQFSEASANAELDPLVRGPSASLPSLPKPTEAQPVVRGGIVSPPRLLHSVQPAYPALAMSNHVEGDVQIQTLIDQTGKVISAKVLSGPALLRNAATDAVKQWRYSPATLDGKPTSMEYRVTVSFHLSQ